MVALAFSEFVVEDQLADDEGEGSQIRPRSCARSPSPPSLHRSSRLQRRRIDYSEVSDIDIDLPAKSINTGEDTNGYWINSGQRAPVA